MIEEAEAPVTVLTPEQIAKRQHWARVLLDGATDKTSYLLAERLIQDWFGKEQDKALSQAKARVSR